MSKGFAVLMTAIISAFVAVLGLVTPAGERAMSVFPLTKALREKDVLTPQEFRTLLEELSVRDRAMVLLAGSTGARRSELMALKYSDLDIHAMEIKITKSCVRNRFGDTKTQSSRRPVPLHPLVLESLLDWKLESLYKGDDDFLFPSTWHQAS